MVVAAQLVAKVSAEGTEASAAKISAFDAKVKETRASLVDFTKGAVLLGAAAVIGVGVAATKMAGDFQSGTTTFVTGAGELSSNLDMVRQGILKMAVDTGTSTKQLTDGMFMVESANYHGADALKVLQAAAEGAKVGHADLAVVANAVTTVMNDYGLSASHAADATNFLNAIVANGKTTMQDLAASMSGVLPTASALHVGLKDVGAAMATMTYAGVPAADAATYLRQMLMSLAAPAKAGQKALADIGLTVQQVSDGMKTNLPATLQLIMDHLKATYKEGSPQYVEAMKNIAGGAKQMQGFLDLTGDHLSIFKQDLQKVSDQMNQGAGQVAGWNAVQGDFNFAVDQAKESVETFMIKLGTGLLPLLTPLVSNIAKAVSAFGTWATSGHALGDMLSLTGKYAQIAIPILAALGVVIGTILVTAAISLVTSLSPLIFIMAGVAAAVAGLSALFVHFYQTNAGFRSFVDGAAEGLKQLAGFVQANFLPAMKELGALFQTYVLPFLQQIGSFIVSQFQPVWQNLVALWNSQLLPLIKQLWAALQQLQPLFQFIASIVGGVLVVAFVTLMGIIHGVIAALATIISDVGSAIGGVVQVITGIVQVIGGIVQLIKDLFTGNFSALGNDLKGIWQGIVNIFGGIFQTLGSIVHAVFAGIASFIGGFVQGIGDTIGHMLGMADTAKIQAEEKQDEMKLHSINSAMQTSEQVLKEADKQRQGILKELENTKDPKKRAELEMQLQAVTAKEDEAKKVIDQERQKKEGILKHLADLKQQAEDANKNIFQKAADWFGQTKDKAVQLFNDMKNGIGGKLTDLKNMVGGWFSDFGKFWHDQWQGLVDGLTNIWNGITGTIKGAINSIIDVINMFINGLDKLHVNIPGGGSVGFNIPDIPHLSTGGTVTQGGLATVGDTGVEQVWLPPGARVIPNSQTFAGAAPASSGQPLILQVDGRQFARVILPALSQEMRYRLGTHGM